VVHVLAAPDKFRGTATAAEVADAVAVAVADVGGTCDRVPMADGGEGFLDVLGGANRTTVVTGPLGDEVEARWRLVGTTAVVEMAQASGLALLATGEMTAAEANDALAASTFGTGELMAAAIDAGARRILVGVGGSATTDGGFGAQRALYPLQRLRGIDIVVACDVRTVFLDAPAVFAPQKGASDSQVQLLQRRLERLADVFVAEHGVDVRELVGSGAGGGLAGGLAAVGADLVPGFDLVADEVSLFDRMESADLVVTGEGFVDRESFDGKVVGGVLSYAAELGVPALVVAGEVFDDVEVASALAGASGSGSGHGSGSGRGVTVVSLVERFGAERAMADTAVCVTEVVAHYLAAPA
jgi:glycerate kinase